MFYFLDQISNPGNVECERCPDGRYNPKVHEHRTQVRDHVFQRLITPPTLTEASRQIHDNDNDCAVCPTGFYSGTGTNVATRPLFTCIGCPGGQYQDQEEKIDCLECAIGKYADFKLVDCLNCGQGTFQNEEGQASCKTCENGKWNNVDDSDASKHIKDTDCDMCPVGRYSDGDSLRGKLSWSNFGLDKPRLTTSFNYKVQDSERSLFSIRGKIEMSVTEYHSSSWRDHKGQWKHSYDKCQTSCSAHAASHPRQNIAGIIVKPIDLGATRTICRSLGRVEAHATPDFLMITEVPKDDSYNVAHNLQCSWIETLSACTQKWSSLNPVSTELVTTGHPIGCSVESSLFNGNPVYRVYFRSPVGNVDMKECSYTVRHDDGVVYNSKRGIYQGNLKFAASQTAPHPVIECGACLPGLTDSVVTFDGSTRNVTTLNDGGWCADYRNNRRECIACPAGWHNTNQGQTICTRCELGRYSPVNNVGLQECTLCELGFYNDEETRINCKKCPRGR